MIDEITKGRIAFVLLKESEKCGEFIADILSSVKNIVYSAKKKGFSEEQSIEFAKVLIEETIREILEEFSQARKKGNSSFRTIVGETRLYRRARGNLSRVETILKVSS